MRAKYIIGPVLFLILSGCINSLTEKDASPNIIIILADDLGCGVMSLNWEQPCVTDISYDGLCSSPPPDTGLIAFAAAPQHPGVPATGYSLLRDRHKYHKAAP